MVATGKASGRTPPGNIRVPSSSSTISAVQGSESVEIDISDVALAPGEGPPPVPLRKEDTKEGLPPLIRQTSTADDSSSRTNDRITSHVEDISPWRFQDGDWDSWPSRSRQNTQETAPSNNASSFYQTSQTSLPHRPGTPPSLRESLSNTAPTMTPGKRSMNPLNFFRKKSSLSMRDDGSPRQHPSLAGQSNAYLGAMPSQSKGLDEEILADDNDASRDQKRDKKRMVRPRTRDKESRKNKATADLWDQDSQERTGFGQPFGQLGSATQEIPIALDTNFDQIDDIVNPSLRQQSLVGPMDERLSPEGPFTPQSPPDAVKPISNSPSSRSHLRERTGSVTFADRPVDPNASPLRSVRASSSGLSNSTEKDEHTADESSPSPSLFPPKSGLRKLSRQEAQQLLAHSPRQFRGEDRGTAPATHNSAIVGSVEATEASGMTMDARKASVASSSNSRVTAGSGISPTTSLSHLPTSSIHAQHVESAQATASNGGSWTQQSWDGRGAMIDSNYRFPTQTNAEGPRKSSASSGKVASSWMAPDSWAVQPGTMRDALRDEDGEEENSDEKSSEQRPSLHRGLSSATASSFHNGNNASSGTVSGATESMSESIPSHLQDRRGTIDSTATSSSTGEYDMSRRPSDSSSIIEILAGPTSNSTTPTSSGGGVAASSSASRPTSRGHTISVVPAAAAKKLGLTRPTRIKLPNSRPNTGGSTKEKQGGVGTPTHELDGFFGAWKSSKRPSGHGSHSTAKLSYVRIYRHDDTHSIVTIPLTATAAELRALLSRKTHDPSTKRLFVRDKGSERPLGESEKPAILQRRRLEQAGYKESDGLDELGREDLSYLLTFVYRPDSVTKLESNAFGDTETDFNRLDLQNKNLEMVPIFLYRHADWIQSLDLSGNPMSDLPLDFVQLCTNLSTLRLSHLALKRIPQSIRHAAKLTHLDLSDNRIPELAHVNLEDVRQLRSLKVQNNRLFELPIYFASMQTLRDLNISNNRFEIFPPIICQIPSLVQLDVSFNTIAELPSELGNLINLQRLVLVGNMIVKLPPEISKLVKLQAIDVRRNLLQDVSELFALPQLQVLQCEHNSIKHLTATFGLHLRVLEIGQNPLSKATFTAQDICALTSLDLSSANMGKLDENVLSRLPNLTQLVLDKNTLVVLPENLGDLTQLRRLSCSNNLLATLPESLGQLTKLEELQVHNNNLKTLPSSIWMCPKLHTINVSSNLLESFPDPQLRSVDEQQAAPSSMASSQIVESRKGSITSLATPSSTPVVAESRGSRHSALPLSACLTRLRLGDNCVTEDIFDVLGHLTNLRVLNLSSNELYELPTYGLSKLVKLEELYLSGNSLSSVPADVLPMLQELRILHLNGNKLQTLPAELGKVKKLVNLDVGNNSLKYNISNQQYDWNWNSNPNLRYLNLSGNKRLEIKSNPILVGGADQRSGWKRTDTSDFQRLTNLRLLGLMDVTVTLHQMPDQFEDRRVRTSLSQINQMAYGISDALGKHDHLSIIDVVIPRFRKLETECMFGLFAGRGHGSKTGSRIAFHLAEWVQFRIQWEVQRLQPQAPHMAPDPEQMSGILRRAFLRMEKEYADVLIAEGSRKRSEAKNMAGKDDRKIDATAIAEAHSAVHWKSGASAVLAYVVNRTLFVANVGDSLAVLCRNSQAFLASTKHEPFDRDETLRIRSAEGWVSLHGQVNDKLDVSRSIGHYHLAPIVNAAPAVTKIDLTDSDEFVILANRTLWDVMPYQTAVDIARMQRDDPMMAAQKLRDFAISYGAEDSIMVMVVAVGDLFEKSRTTRNGASSTNAGGYAAGSLNDLSSSAFEAEFRKVTPRRAREDRDLPGDRTLARLQREVAPPIGQVAVVFTDIKNSTSLWETNGGMQSAMRLHNFLLRRQLRNIGGYEVKTEGDAFMVSFQNVTSALLWCFQVQIQLLKENWPQELLEGEDGKEVYDGETGELLYRGLSVRMGLHWGWPVCEADPITRRMDYFGPMVNRASRISGAADGGQILVSRDVVNELRAIMGTFEEDKTRTLDEDGLMLGEEDEYGNLDAEETFRLLHPNVGRDVILLRRMGFAISEIGERRLKGLETPEFLYLVYPKSLTRRHTAATQPLEAAPGQEVGGAKVIEEALPSDPLTKEPQGAVVVQAPHEVFEPTVQLLNIDEVRALGFICLRLEALAQGMVFKGIEDLAGGGDYLSSSRPPSSEYRGSMIFSPGVAQVGGPSSTRQVVVEGYINRHPELSMYAIRDDATDNELHTILKQITGRIWIALSSLTLRKFVKHKMGDISTELETWGSRTDLMALVDMLRQHM